MFGIRRSSSNGNGSSSPADDEAKDRVREDEEGVKQKGTKKRPPHQGFLSLKDTFNGKLKKGYMIADYVGGELVYIKDHKAMVDPDAALNRAGATQHIKFVDVKLIAALQGYPLLFQLHFIGDSGRTG